MRRGRSTCVPPASSRSSRTPAAAPPASASEWRARPTRPAAGGRARVATDNAAMPETTRGAAPERVAPVTLGTSILGGIGNTPLLRIRLFERECPGVAVYGKAEFLNAGGSVKDRAALRMIRDGEASGALTPDRIILDSTSGNTGIAYAMVGAALGYRVRLVMPTNVSDERKTMILAYGAEIVYSDAQEGSDGAIRDGPAHLRRGPRPRTSCPTSTTTRPTGRRTTTAPARRSGARPRARSPTSSPRSAPAARSWACRGGCAPSGRTTVCISVQPEDPWHGLEGMKHMPTAIVPGHLRPVAGRRQPLGADRGRRTTSPRELARSRGHHGRPLQRRRAVGRARDRAAHRARRHRHRALRRRQPVPELRACTAGAWDDHQRRSASATDADDAIRGLAAAAYPNEGCGVLIGRFAGDARRGG